jgi:arylsulfatase A-like enzyme/Tfp pilus assembly protein PilF
VQRARDHHGHDPGRSPRLLRAPGRRDGARANGTYRLGAEHTTLAEILKASGYITGAFVSAYVLDSRFGLDQGFDLYDDDLSQGVKYSDHMFRERPAQFTSTATLAWLETLGKGKFLAWVHYFDPHAPYFPPEPFRSTYAARPYDGEIAYVDREIGALLSGLAALGKLDDTLIVVASDHGEGLGEHGEQTHSLLVYDSTLHTPLVICPPAGRSGPRGTVIDRQVSNADIVPTILELLGIESDVTFDGVSLAAPPQAHDESIYAETISTLVLHGWSPLFAVRRQDLKYIHAPRPELYDLAGDPQEIENLFEQRPDPAAALSIELEEHIGDDLFGARALAQQVEMDPETARRLGALGYVGTVSPGEVEPGRGALLDPKDMVPHWERIQAAENDRARGSFPEAVAELEACLETVPGDVWTMRLLMSAYLEMGDLDRAQAMAEQVLALERNEPSIYLALGRIAMLRLRMAEAEAHFNRALDVDPDFAAAYVTLGNLYALTSGPRRALEYFQRAIEMDPGTAGPNAWCAIGQMHLGRLELDRAREAFDNALAIDKLNGQAHSGLAMVLIEQNRLEEAEAQMEAAMRFHPNDVLALATLAGLHNKKEEYEQAIARPGHQRPLPARAERPGIGPPEHGRSGRGRRGARHRARAQPGLRAVHRQPRPGLPGTASRRGSGSAFRARPGREPRAARGAFQPRHLQGLSGQERRSPGAVWAGRRRGPGLRPSPPPAGHAAADGRQAAGSAAAPREKPRARPRPGGPGTTRGADRGPATDPGMKTRSPLRPLLRLQLRLQLRPQDAAVFIEKAAASAAGRGRPLLNAAVRVIRRVRVMRTQRIDTCPYVDAARQSHAQVQPAQNATDGLRML